MMAVDNRYPLYLLGWYSEFLKNIANTNTVSICLEVHVFIYYSKYLK